jgi:hypothetical protein
VAVKVVVVFVARDDSRPPDTEEELFPPDPPYPKRLQHDGKEFAYDKWELAWAGGERRTRVFYREA